MEANHANGISREVSIKVDFHRREREVKRAAVSEPSGRSAEKLAADREETKKRVKELLNSFSPKMQLRMYYDDDINQLVVTVLDGDTQRVVRQIPDQEVVEFIKSFQQCIGMIVDRRV